MTAQERKIIYNTQVGSFHIVASDSDTIKISSYYPRRSGSRFEKLIDTIDSFDELLMLCRERDIQTITGLTNEHVARLAQKRLGFAVSKLQSQMTGRPNWEVRASVRDLKARLEDLRATSVKIAARKGLGS